MPAIFAPMLSFTEENYLKTLLQIGFEKSDNGEAGTTEIAAMLKVKPATANDMLKKLKEKKLINYQKYGKSTLTKEGKKVAIEIVRKHRLWETFLYEKLEFTWDEVHEVAEHLEHIQSKKLIDKIDKLLGYPAFDPHGDAIPNTNGEMVIPVKRTLLQEEVGHNCKMVGVKDNTATFLQYVGKVGLAMNSGIKVLAKHEIDGLIEIEINGKKTYVSPKFAEKIVIVCEKCSKSNTRSKKKRV